MACGILALNCESHLALKLALDSRVLVLVLVSRVQASASASASVLALKGPGLGLGLGLEDPGLGLGPWPLDFGLDYNTAPSFHWVGLGRDFLISIGSGWVRQSMGWVGLGHIKWTHGQL